MPLQCHPTPQNPTNNPLRCPVSVVNGPAIRLGKRVIRALAGLLGALASISRQTGWSYRRHVTAAPYRGHQAVNIPTPTHPHLIAVLAVVAAAVLLLRHRDPTLVICVVSSVVGLQIAEAANEDGEPRDTN